MVEAKQTTEQKIAVVSPPASPMFIEGLAVNAICGALIIGGIAGNGISVTVTVEDYGR